MSQSAAFPPASSDPFESAPEPLRSELRTLTRRFAEAGAPLTLFPLHDVNEDGSCGCNQADCDKAGKHPTVMWNARDLPRGTIKFKEGAKGYGYVTGNRRGEDANGPRMATLDFDTSDAWNTWIQENGKPETLILETGKGYHAIYVTDGRPVRMSHGQLAENVDLKADGGYTAAPGSLHKSGRYYKVVEDAPIAPLPRFILDHPAVMPRAAAEPGASAIARGAEYDDWGYRMRLGAEHLAKNPPLPSGRGVANDHFVAVAQYLARSIVLPIPDCLQLLEPWNAKCLTEGGARDPWSQEEMTRTLVRMADHGRWPCDTAPPEGWQLGTPPAPPANDASAEWDEPSGVFEVPETRKRRTAAEMPEAQALLARLDVGKNEARARDEEGGYPLPNSFVRGDHAEMARELIASCGHRLVTSEGTIWAYYPELGVWSDKEVEKQLRTTILNDFAGIPTGGQGKPKRINNADVDGTIKSLKTLTDKCDFFADATPGVACENGFVTMTRIEPHSHEHRARTHYPLAFEADCESASWDAFLRDLFRDDPDQTEKIACVEEFFGGALFGLATRYQKCLVCTGEGSNGKSTLFKIVRDVFPDGSVQAIAPKKWEHAFTIANLRGTLLNLVSDMPHGAIIDSEHFKEIVAGDVVTAEEKHKPAFPLRPIAGHIFACNALPATSDHSFGFWRRFIVLGFNRNFENDPGRDTAIAEKIIATERAGILSRLVAGARRLAARGAYTVPASHAKALAGWQHETDSVTLFNSECLKDAAGGPPGFFGEKQWVGARELYSHYRSWAEINGYKPCANRVFAKRMADVGRHSVKKEQGMVYNVDASCVSEAAKNMSARREAAPYSPATAAK